MGLRCLYPGQKIRCVCQYRELHTPLYAANLDFRSRKIPKKKTRRNMLPEVSLNGGILLLYYHTLGSDAPTIMEHVNAFRNHSRLRIFPVNTVYGFWEGLRDIRFKAVIFHYSLFGSRPFFLAEDYLRYFEKRPAYKVAFFQDEYRYWPEREAFIRRMNLDRIYSLIEPKYFGRTYRRCAPRADIVPTLAGYVTEGMLAAAKKYSLPTDERKLDVGYRSRRLPIFYGKGSQEKCEIALRFKEYLKSHPSLSLVTDIEIDEDRRVYGKAWYEFLGNCRGVLGVESGVSITDMDNSLERMYECYLIAHPHAGSDEIYADILEASENSFPIRTISPRHFEAAAFRICQIQFEGEYSGVMKPGVHYLELKKDFSNINEVISRFRDPEMRRNLTENAYRDLIASGKYHEKKFIREFDEKLMSNDFYSKMSLPEMVRVRHALSKGLCRRVWLFLKSRSFPGKKLLKQIFSAISNSLRHS